MWCPGRYFNILDTEYKRPFLIVDCYQLISSVFAAPLLVYRHVPTTLFTSVECLLCLEIFQLVYSHYQFFAKKEWLSKSQIVLHNV